MNQRESFYDSIADDFDRMMNPYDLRRRLEVVYDQLLSGVDLNGSRLLDAGCGTGAFSLAAALRGARVFSLDLGPRLVRVARAKGVNAGVVGSVLVLPFADAAFDVVVSSEVIEHTPEPRVAIEELVRVLKPGGRLALTCPNRFWHWSARLAGALGLRQYRGLENWPRWRELTSWTAAAGVDVVEQRGLHLFPFQLATCQPLLERLDSAGQRLGRFYINQCLAGHKPRR